MLILLNPYRYVNLMLIIFLMSSLFPLVQIQDIAQGLELLDEAIEKSNYKEVSHFFQMKIHSILMIWSHLSSLAYDIGGDVHIVSDVSLVSGSKVCNTIRNRTSSF